MTELSFHRGRRLRRTPALRDMVRETSLSAADLIMPYFVVDTPDEHFRQPINSMPGQFQLSLAELEKEIGEAVKLGLRSVLLFGIPAEKDPLGSGAYARDGIVQRATRMIKKNWPDLVVITDLCCANTLRTATAASLPTATRPATCSTTRPSTCSPEPPFPRPKPAPTSWLPPT